MRDIKKRGNSKKSGGERFNPKPPFPEDLPPDVKELYEKYAQQDGDGDNQQKEKKESPAKEQATGAESPPNVPAGVETGNSTKPKKEEKQETSEKPASKPRFTGSKVPIANVHVSRQDLSQKAKRVTRRKNSTVTPIENSQSEATEPVEEAAEPIVEAKPEQSNRPLYAKFTRKSSKTDRKAGESAKPMQRMRLAHRDRKLVAILLLVVLLAAGLAAVMFLPRANLTLTLATAPLLVDHSFTVQASGVEGAGAVPGQVVAQDIPVEGSSAVTSTKVVGEKASGTVRVINRTFEEQSIKEESRLVTEDGQLYYMQGHAIVPAAEGSTLGVATVPVLSDVAGPEANLESGRLNFAALDSSAQSVVYAEVAQPITGGSGEEVAVVQESDLEAAREEASRLALQQLEATTELPEGYTLLEESKEGVIVNFETTAELEDEAETIPFTATVRAQVMSYKETNLEEALRVALEEQLDDDYMLFPSPLSFTKSVEDVDWQNQQAQVTARVTHTTIPTFSLDTLRDKLAGRSESEATEYLRGLPGVKAVDIELWPFWVTNIPRIGQRVGIELQPDRQP